VSGEDGPFSYGRGPSVPDGIRLIFHAIPTAGVFVRWYGPCAGQSALCRLTITTDTSVVAEFDLAQ